MYKMNHEEERFRTFMDLEWPRDAPVSADRIAKAGFFYKGTMMAVECYKCHVVISEWEYGDQVMQKHRLLNAECPFVNDPLHSDNIPIVSILTNMITPIVISDDDSDANFTPTLDYKDATTRFRTFLNNNKFISTQMFELADDGFYSVGIEDIIQCNWCNFKVKALNNMNPITEHHLRSKECIKVMDLPQEITGEKSFDFNIIYTDALLKNPTYKHFEVRLKSYLEPANWPHNSISPRSLSFAGLFYTLQDDLVRCFECDIGLEKWKAGENPLVEHARHSKNCKFITNLTSQDFIQMCKVISCTSKPPCLPKSSSSLECCSPATKVTHLEEEVRTLRESMICKICMDNELEVVFMPCQHVVTCTSCSRQMNICPICRGVIKQKVEMRFS